MIKENKKIQGLDFSQEEIAEAIKSNRILSLDIEFSRRCNLRCLYCYATPDNVPPGELTTEEIKRVIDESISLGARNIVNIGGGEPLMFKDYWDILAYEKEKNVNTITFTNGTFIDESTARKLYSFDESVALKFNSFDNAIQDSLVGKKGTGTKIKKALEYLLQAGYTKQDSPKLILETIVCRQNYAEIEKIYKFCRENNIQPYVEILTTQNSALENLNSLKITPAEGLDLFQRLLKYDQEVHSISWPLTPPIAGQSCKRILYSAYVTSTGNVQPCPGVEVINPDYNIRNRSLDWIIKNSDVFKNVRGIYSNLKGECKTCEYSDCYGCRGSAFFGKGDYLESDPTCWWNSPDNHH